MEIGITMAIDRLTSTINEFSLAEPYDVQLTNAGMIKECAMVIANSTEEQLLEALKQKKQSAV